MKKSIWLILNLSSWFLKQLTATGALVLRPLLKTEGASQSQSVTWCPYRQNEREMFSDHDETSPSIAAVSAPLRVDLNYWLWQTVPTVQNSHRDILMMMMMM